PPGRRTRLTSGDETEDGGPRRGADPRRRVRGGSVQVVAVGAEGPGVVGGQRVAALGQLVGEAGVDLEQRAVGGGRGGGVHGVVGRGDLVLLPVGAGGAQLHQDAAAALQAVGVARDALVVAAGVEADVGVAVGVLDGLGGGHHGLPGQLQGAVADVGVGGPQHRGGDLLALVVDVAALHVVVDDQVGG